MVVSFYHPEHLFVNGVFRVCPYIGTEYIKALIFALFLLINVFTHKQWYESLKKIFIIIADSFYKLHIWGVFTSIAYRTEAS